MFDHAADSRSCQWCHRPLPEAAATGRPRLYCSHSCRQHGYQWRRSRPPAIWEQSRVRSLLDRLYAVQSRMSENKAALDQLAARVADLQESVDNAVASVERTLALNRSHGEARSLTSG